MLAVSSATVFASITTPASVLNTNLKTSGNYAWLGDADPSYNCLAYVVNNYGSWVWPWGTSNPTGAQADTFIANAGWPYAQPMNSLNVALYRVISYGTSSNIKHFALIDGDYTNAKWGQLERLQHYGWNPYTNSGFQYGEAYHKYAPQ